MILSNNNHNKKLTYDKNLIYNYNNKWLDIQLIKRKMLKVLK